MRVLTIDLGTSAAKACVWAPTGLVATASVELLTRHPRPGWAEQDTTDWWQAVCAATRRLPLAGVDGVVLTGQRETVVPVGSDGTQLRPALLWSDSRGSDQSVTDAAGHRIGATAALARWIAQYDPDVLDRAVWLAGPRDWIVWSLTGQRVTDRTMASRTGLYDLGTWRPDPGVCAVAGVDPELLPQALPSESVVGQVTRAAGIELGLRPGTPVVLGAGDRQCEVLGVGAGPSEPMVSWGTTVNLSIPAQRRPAETAAGAVSAAIGGGWLLECGLSSAGAALTWLALGSGISAGQLSEAALSSEPGARGIVCLPWLAGARAPWWTPGAGASWLGVTLAHSPGDLARALFEGVAHDVRRCLQALAPDSTTLRTAGGGADEPAWLEALSGVTAHALVGRSVPVSASIGAALLGAGALGGSYDRDAIAPPRPPREPSRAAVEAHARLIVRHDAAAEMVLGWSQEHPLT